MIDNYSQNNMRILERIGYSSVEEIGNLIDDPMKQNSCFVYRGKIWDRDVSLKMDNPFNFMYGRQVDNEVKILSCTGHINGLAKLVALHNDVVTPEFSIPVSIIAKEYVRGDPILDKNYSLRQYFSLFKTVKELHKLGIVNLDLKPENIILDKKTRLPKMIDFGVMRFSSELDNPQAYIKDDLTDLATYQPKELTSFKKWVLSKLRF
jgi:serine/threonine protein kinase